MSTHLPPGFLADLDRLNAAVAALIDPHKQMINNVVHVAASLYDELAGEVPATARRLDYTRAATGSRPPVWVDALDLRVEIDDALQCWQPAGYSTPARLRALAAKRWRPQDSSQVEQITRNVESWCVEIRALLDPEGVRRISAPCPACGATHVYRLNSAGDHIRQPALQLVADQGCTCRSCRHTWLPQHYLLLSRVLGFDAPKGVLAE
ncbi:hypothetical protein PDG61_10110 [Mycolicibacterium sp. BiH015]|uniref:DUF7341 domain-containing protein n=1 Tax=Mycolicibacterium sp. BiH015 TaxID=3018808 RepID=UPI0022E3D43B|nr:hypothetical protein [Mycolicibacterium sp. BiH015]MDA2891262.1 hypothetical protein [Mycolicibacterium sp. BiH015]